MRAAPPVADAAPVAAGAAQRAGAEEDDRALAERAPTDADAFAQLYRRYVGAIHEFAYRRSGSRDLAEDVTSATFEKALRSLERFEWRRGGFRAWLYRIAANELTDQFRRLQRDTTPRAQRTLRALAAGDDGAFETAEERTGGDGARVMEAMAALTPRYQEALSLRFLSGLSVPEAAAALGCTRGTLAVVVHRALAALRRELGRGEVAT
jgi:RNA polymerase sigma-70 factor (ECF subfamily)